MTLPKPQVPQAPGPDAEQGPKTEGRGARAGTVWSISATGPNPHARHVQDGGMPRAALFHFLPSHSWVAGEVMRRWGKKKKKKRNMIVIMNEL